MAKPVALTPLDNGGRRLNMSKSVTVNQIVELGLNREEFQVIVDFKHQVLGFVKEKLKWKNLPNRGWIGNELLRKIYELCGKHYPDKKWNKMIGEGKIVYDDSVLLKELLNPYLLLNLNCRLAYDFLFGDNPLKEGGLKSAQIKKISYEGKCYRFSEIEEEIDTKLGEQSRTNIFLGMALIIAHPHLIKEGEKLLFTQPLFKDPPVQRYYSITRSSKGRFLTVNDHRECSFPLNVNDISSVRTN